MTRSRSALPMLDQRLISAMVRPQPAQYGPVIVQMPTQGVDILEPCRFAMVSAVYAPRPGLQSGPAAYSRAPATA